MRFDVRSSAVVLGLVVVVGGLGALIEAAILEDAQYIFPDPNTELGDPDPTVWAQGGNLEATPVEGDGLRITDPGDTFSLLYFRPSTQLAAPGLPATFRARVRNFALNPGSAAWSNNVTGFRLIFDDAQRRLILGLGRDPSGVLQIVLLQAMNPPLPVPGVDPIPFNWASPFYHTYEVGRLSSGDYYFGVTSGDPNEPNSVTRDVPGFTLPPSGGAAVFIWGMGISGGGSSTWQEVRAQVVEQVIDMGLDTDKLTLDLNAHHSDNEIEWRGELMVPAGATIDAVAETVSIDLTSGDQAVFQTMIPPGSFTLHPNGSYRYESPGNSPSIEMRLTPRGGSLWEFRINVEGILLNITDRTQMAGELTIGDKVGTQQMPLTDKGKRLEFKKP